METFSFAAEIFIKQCEWFCWIQKPVQKLHCVPFRFSSYFWSSQLRFCSIMRKTGIVWTVLYERGHGGSPDRKRGWRVPKITKALHGETCVTCIVTFHFLASLSISVTLLTSIHEYSFGMVHFEEVSTVVSIFCSWQVKLFYTRFQPVVDQHCTLKCVLALNWW